MNNTNIPIERHPWEPFVPENSRVLILGAFPPKSNRWSMEFYYPNRINDFWRIIGLVFFADKDHFELDMTEWLNWTEWSHASLVAQMVKNQSAMQETWVWSLGWEDDLEKEATTHSSILWLPWWLSWKRIGLQCGRPAFYPWLGKDPSEKGTATHSSILAWRIPWTV